MRTLLDQMFPHATCRLLNDRGHDAVHVRDRGVGARPDAEVVAVASAEERVIVTENVKDFAGVHGVTVVCVQKSRLPPQGMHVHLAEMLDKWALAHPEPYRGAALAIVIEARRLQPNLQPNGTEHGGLSGTREMVNALVSTTIQDPA